MKRMYLTWLEFVSVTIRYSTRRYDNFSSRIHNKILDCDWFSVCLLVIVIGPSGVQFRE